jgi:GntR family transcriptional regulator, galactonate operon transcriptional repressor
MNISESRLGASISRVLVDAAMESRRYRADIGTKYFNDTLTEHAEVLKAIADRDPVAAREAMRRHILVAWERRRLPVTRRISD